MRPRVSLSLGHSSYQLAPATGALSTALRDGYNAGKAARFTRWHLPTADLRDPSPRTKRSYAIMDGLTVIGSCGLWSGSYGGLEFYIAIFDERHRGRGLGSLAVKKLCEVAFRELRAQRVELGVYPENKRAIGVYERCGFKREAILRRWIYNDGKWRDALWMSLLRREWGGRR